MALRPLGPGSSTEDIIQVVNENNSDIDNRFRTYIVKDETGLNRIILGKLPDGSYGLAISIDGEDVLDAFTDD